LKVGTNTHFEGREKMPGDEIKEAVARLREQGYDLLAIVVDDYVVRAPHGDYRKLAKEINDLLKGERK
jgi:hypothetical protein